MSDITIVLRHIGGERKVVPVEYIAPSATYLSVRWGQSGIYDLNLTKNVLTARSQKAQRKGKAHWVAEDIDAVRFMVRQYLAEKTGLPTKAQVAIAAKKHEATMPGAAPDPYYCSECLVANGYHGEGCRGGSIMRGVYEPFPRYSGDPE